MERSEMISWLRENDAARLAKLWREADEMRRHCVGDEVHLRGLVEFSNYCVRQCAYCGLWAPNRKVSRYRMSAEEILDCARQASSLGYGTVVLQSGEDPAVEKDWLAGVIRAIKAETPLAVTLSVGERSPAELSAWREAGADRYLLRFETSNRRLYERIHPPRPDQGRSDRLAILATRRKLDYEVGSGVMIGIPGQTYDDLARDVALFTQLDLDMIGCGPYLPHPDTPMGLSSPDQNADTEQAPATELMAYKLVALARLACPQANIPSTTALATLNPQSGYELSLTRGANVVMPNLSPAGYRIRYKIYPGKVCAGETAEGFHASLLQRLGAIGRTVGRGRGDSPNSQRRGEPAATSR